MQKEVSPLDWAITDLRLKLIKLLDRFVDENNLEDAETIAYCYKCITYQEDSETEFSTEGTDIEASQELIEKTHSETIPCDPPEMVDAADLIWKDIGEEPGNNKLSEKIKIPRKPWSKDKAQKARDLTSRIADCYHKARSIPLGSTVEVKEPSKPEVSRIDTNNIKDLF